MKQERPQFMTHETKTSDSRLLKMGIIGTAFVALCCFTPVLVVLLGVVGFSAMLGWLDYVLMPALVFFVGLTVYAVRRRQKRMNTF
jgi:mercuric ion transport protein